MQALADRIAEGEEVLPTVATPGVATAGSTPVEAEVDAEGEAEAVEAAAAQAADTQAGEGMLPASVDALLLEILDTEVSGHLATVDAWLTEAQSASTPATDALLRAVHTMNGAFAMTEVPAITDALSPAETYIRRLLAAKQDASGEGVRSEEHTSELQSLMRISYAVFCLTKKKHRTTKKNH